MTDRKFQPVPMTVAIVVHLALLALILMPVRTPAIPKAAALALFDLAAAPEPLAPRPQPVRPTPPVVAPPLDVSPPVPSEPVVAVPGSADPRSTGGVCDLTAPVQAALQASDEVRASLLRMPRDGRSVANAIMVWNADWIVAEAEPEAAALATVREVVAATIAAASPDCRLQPQGGPRLLVLSGPGENMVLALGSGRWRWQDLLDTARSRSSAPETG